MKVILFINLLSFLGVVFLKDKWKFGFDFSLLVYVATLYGTLYYYLTFNS